MPSPSSAPTAAKAGRTALTDIEPRGAPKRLGFLGAAVVGVLGIAGCASAPVDESDEGNALIGGTEISVDELPSVVDVARVPRAGLPTDSGPLVGSCTAAQIGSRHLLLAAHCVLDPATVSPIWKAHDPIALLSSPIRGWKQGKVERVEIHPAWLAACDRTYCAASIVTAKMDAPDVAVLVLEEAIPDSSISPASDRRLQTGDDVIVTGFGCTEGVHVSDSRAQVSLRAKATRIAAPGVALHPGSPLSADDLTVANGNYNFTLGPSDDALMAGLCPGDSGGPVYRKLDGKLVVVGVNANYTLPEGVSGDRGLPITNWHTRLDRESRHDVAGWLRGLRVDAP